MNPKIYVAFYWGTAWLSKLVSWFTRGGPSHVALVYYDSKLSSWMQIGSESNGFVYLPLRAADVGEVYEFPDLDLWKGYRLNLQWLNAGYDFGGFVGMGYVMTMWNWFKRKVKNPLQRSKTWFCSEIVAQILKDAGASLELEPGDTDPERLRDEVRGVGAVKLEPHLVLR